MADWGYCMECGSALPDCHCLFPCRYPDPVTVYHDDSGELTVDGVPIGNLTDVSVSREVDPPNRLLHREFDPAIHKEIDDTISFDIEIPMHPEDKETPDDSQELSERTRAIPVRNGIQLQKRDHESQPYGESKRMTLEENEAEALYYYLMRHLRGVDSD